MRSILPELVTKYTGAPCMLYGRVSTVVQESDGYSLHNQARDGRVVAAQLRASVVAEDFEQGSGQDWDLAGIANVIRLAKEGRIQLMIAKNVTRLSRDIGKQAWLEHQLREAGVEIFYYDEQYDDTPAGRFARDMFGRAGQWQLEISRELSMQAKLDKVTDFGRPVGNGQTPYGWQRVIDKSGKRPRTVGYEHDPAEAAVIRRFRSLLTMSTPAFCEMLNAEGIPAPGKWRPTERRRRSGKWAINSVHAIFKNPMIWGEYRYGVTETVKVNGKVRNIPKRDAEPVTLQFEPILTKAEVHEIRAVLASRTNRGARLRLAEEDDPYILRGSLTCGLCGSLLSTRSNGDAASPYRTYRCLRSIPAIAKRYHAPEVCTTPALIANTRPERSGAEGIEDMVWRAVPALLDEATVRAAIERSRQTDDSAETHADRLAFICKTLEMKTKALAVATQRMSEADDDLDRESFAATRESLKGEIRALRASLDRLEAYVPSGVSRDDEEGIVALVCEMRDILDDASPAERRELLRRLRVRGVVTPDSEGPYQIGRHRYAIAWSGIFDLGQTFG